MYKLTIVIITDKAYSHIIEKKSILLFDHKAVEGKHVVVNSTCS